MLSKDETRPAILVSHLGYGSTANKAVIAVVPDGSVTAELLGPVDSVAAETVPLEPGAVEHVPSG